VKRIAVAAAALVGLLTIVGGVVVALTTTGERLPTTESWVIGAAFALGLVGLAIALWKIRGSLDGDSANPVPWAPDGPFATPAPERSDETYPISSDRFAERVAEAGSAARSEGSVEAGMAVARPFLRRALLDGLDRGRGDREAIEERIDRGEWTDDRLAASALSASVAAPPRSVRRRLSAWLFPERIVRERAARAMNEIARATDETLATVPGQHAPRTVPVLQPNLEDLSRGADGKLQEAADPDVVARGPGPRQPADPEEGSPDAPGDGTERRPGAPTSADEFLDPLGDGFAESEGEEAPEAGDGDDAAYGTDPELDALDEEVEEA